MVQSAFTFIELGKEICDKEENNNNKDINIAEESNENSDDYL